MPGNFMRQTPREASLGIPAEMPVFLPTPEIQQKQQDRLLALGTTAARSSRSRSLSRDIEILAGLHPLTPPRVHGGTEWWPE